MFGNICYCYFSLKYWERSTCQQYLLLVNIPRLFNSHSENLFAYDKIYSVFRHFYWDIEIFYTHNYQVK